MNIPKLRTTIHRALDYVVRATPQVGVAEPRHDDAPLKFVFKSERARAEGWDVFACGLREDGSSRIEIQRLDSPDHGQPTFSSDHAAWDHVVTRARDGSALHLRALQMIDQTEHKLIRCFCAPQEVPMSADPAPPPEFVGTWRWREPDPLESIEDWRRRIAPKRLALISSVASWLHPGQAVRVHPDPEAGGGDVAGRVGTIHRLCSSIFADYTYVRFEPLGRERTPCVRMLPLETLEPIE